MARVRNKDTAPELHLRRALFAAGLRFRLHRRDLPGSPDLVLPKYLIAVLVHGCFWHGHDCRRGRRPKTNMEFWESKLDRNIERDFGVRSDLERLGWRVVVVWGCNLDEGVRSIVALVHASAVDNEPLR